MGHRGDGDHILWFYLADELGQVVRIDREGRKMLPRALLMFAVTPLTGPQVVPASVTRPHFTPSG